jgi:hypothetical protein
MGLTDATFLLEEAIEFEQVADVGTFAHVAEGGRSFGGQFVGEFKDFEAGAVDRRGAAEIEHDPDAGRDRGFQIGHDLGHAASVDPLWEADHLDFEGVAVGCGR